MKKMREMKSFNNFRVKMAAFAAVVLMCAAPAALKAQVVDGSEENPIPIYNQEQLKAFAKVSV